MTPARCPADVVIGVGLSSAATASEVRTLVDELRRELGVAIDQIAVIATRECLVDDPRLTLGPPVLGLNDDDLVARSAPVERPFGIQARVAETAALAVASATGGAQLLTPVRRSAHATAAAARPMHTSDRIEVHA